MGCFSLLYRPGTRGEENMEGLLLILITNDAEVIFFKSESVTSLVARNWEKDVLVCVC